MRLQVEALNQLIHDLQELHQFEILPEHHDLPELKLLPYILTTHPLTGVMLFQFHL